MRILDTELKFNPLAVKGYEELYGVTEHKPTKKNPDNKMQFICSLNTSSKDNKFCERMSKIKNTICSKCYARRMLAVMKDLREKQVRSMSEILTRVFKDEEIPLIYKTNNPYDIYRIESFGELHDVSEGGIIQAINYINVIRKNPHINFGWWSKRPDIIDKALKELNITFPDNCNMIYSNPYINGLYSSGKKYNVDAVLQRFNFISGVFTAYTKDYATKHNIKINCGKNICINCLNCYNYHTEKVFYINELLK